MATAIKVNDTVAVIAGKEKGKRGRVLMVLPREEKVIVEKVNFIKRHTKPSQKQRQGGIVEKEGPLHISNVMLYCEHCKKPRRVRHVTAADGSRSRVCTGSTCGQIIRTPK